MFNHCKSRKKSTLFWYIYNKTLNFALMIELSQHIEVLLLENDCVIIPGFGGFVAHYASAARVEGENLFLPPTRSIGFNPQLKLNDGVLVQSYMTVYDTNFSDATKRIEKKVNELIATLHEEGVAELNNIGEIRYTIHNTYEFIPYNHKITTPYLYGLDSFEMKELSALQLPKERVLVPKVVAKEKKRYELKGLRNAVAMIAAVALFFFTSIPVENTSIENENYAQLLPMELFERIEKQSVAVTPVVMTQAKPTARVTSSKNHTASATPAVTRPIAVKEIKVAKETTAAPTKPIESNYHIIVAGGIAMKDAEAMAQKLRSEGYANAKALNKEGKVRVSILSYTTSEEATLQMLQLRKNEAYTSAWMLADK